MFNWLFATAFAEEEAAAVATDTALGTAEAASAGISTETIWIIAFGVLLLAGMIASAVITRRKWNVKMLAFGAICIALSTVLRYIKLFEMPQGGSVTLASMFPLMLFAAAYGAGPGMMVGAAYGFIRYITGGWFTHPVQFLLDYPLAFGLIGLTGLYVHVKPEIREKINGVINGFFNWLCKVFVSFFGLAINDRKERFAFIRSYHPNIRVNWVISLCMILGAFGRMISATAAGVFFWETEFWASAAYNGVYLIPDTLICMLIAVPLADRLLGMMKKDAGRVPARGKHAPMPAPGKAIVNEELAEEPCEEDAAPEAGTEPDAPHPTIPVNLSKDEKND